MTQRMPWFRMYTDFLNDPKLIALAFEDQRHFIGVLALKSDGALEAYVDEQLMDRIVAQRLWIDHGVIREVKRRLVAAGLIDSAWQPLAWDRRQFKSDSSKDRVAAYRANKKAGNGDVTLQQRKSSAVDTDTDTDTDKEEEKKEDTPRKRSAPPPSVVKPDDVDPQTWADWCQLRKAKRATVSLTVIDGARDEAAKAGMSLEPFLKIWCRRGSQGLEASWLKPDERSSAKQPQGKHAGAAQAIWGKQDQHGEIVDV